MMKSNPVVWFEIYVENTARAKAFYKATSDNLAQTLQAASLIGEYNVSTFPVVLGQGKRLFSETAKPSALRLVRSQVSALAL